MGNIAVDARSLPAGAVRSPSCPGPAPAKGSDPSSCARTTRPSRWSCCPLGGAMAPHELVCARVRALVAFCTSIISIHQ